MPFFTKRRPAPLPGASTPGYSVLDANLSLTGDLETDGTLRLDGQLRGSIRRADVVVLGPTARVEGDIAAREVIVAGAVLGNIDAVERVELQPSAVVSGDIATGTVLIQEGGAVRGRLLVRAQEERARMMQPTPRSVRLVAAGGSDAS